MTDNIRRPMFFNVSSTKLLIVNQRISNSQLLPRLGGGIEYQQLIFVELTLFYLTGVMAQRRSVPQRSFWRRVLAKLLPWRCTTRAQ